MTYTKLVNGVPIEMTAEESAARQAEEALPPTAPTKLEILSALFRSLPVGDQAAFGPVAAAVFMFLSQDNPDAARQLILDTPAPEGKEALKNGMLGVFDE